MTGRKLKVEAILAISRQKSPLITLTDNCLRIGGLSDLIFQIDSLLSV